MKYYELDTEFTFGKFKGKTLREILDIQPSYIDWCIINLEHFYISNHVIDIIKSIFPSFSISEEGQNQLSYKLEERESEQREWEERERHQEFLDSCNIKNSPYYNDELDMDQQDPRVYP